MASVLTDQVVRAKLMAPVVGLVGTASKTVQFATAPPFGQTGNATVGIPGTNRLSNLFRVRVVGTLTAVVVQASTVTLNLDGAAIATVAAPGTAGTFVFNLDVTVAFVGATVALQGVQSGFVATTPKAVTTLATNPVVDLTAEGHVLSVAVAAAATDAGYVLTVTEFALEVL